MHKLERRGPWQENTAGARSRGERGGRQKHRVGRIHWGFQGDGGGGERHSVLWAWGLGRRKLCVAGKWNGRERR